MNWLVLLAMLMILGIGMVSYRNNGPTESIIITLVLLMIFYIAYGKYYYSMDGFADITNMTDKQQLAQMIANDMNTKDKEWMLRILQRIGEKKPEIENLDPNFAQIVYDAALPEKTLFETVINENNPKGSPLKLNITFDDFFISMNELLISSNKDPKSPANKFVVNYEPLFKKWVAIKIPTAVASDSGSSNSSESSNSSGSAPISAPPAKDNKQSTLPDLEKLVQVIKPAPATTVQPSASASEIGTVINTSPGLQQGNQYAGVAAARELPPMRPKCPQPCPAPKPSCACQQPIMPDGKPFDPNMYIRKDSIPCWNCQLPI